MSLQTINERIEELEEHQNYLLKEVNKRKKYEYDTTWRMFWEKYIECENEIQDLEEEKEGIERYGN